MPCRGGIALEFPAVGSGLPGWRFGGGVPFGGLLKDLHMHPQSTQRSERHVDPQPSVTLVAQTDADTRKHFPYEWALRYTVTLRGDDDDFQRNIEDDIRSQHEWLQYFAGYGHMQSVIEQMYHGRKQGIREITPDVQALIDKRLAEKAAQQAETEADPEVRVGHVDPLMLCNVVKHALALPCAAIAWTCGVVVAPPWRLQVD